MDSISSLTVMGEYSIGSRSIPDVTIGLIREVDFDGSITFIHKVGCLFVFVKDENVLTVSTPVGQICKLCRDKVHSLFVSSDYIAVLYEGHTLEVFHISLEDMEVVVHYCELFLDKFLSFPK